MKPTIKINFADFWPHLDKTTNFFTQWLSNSFKVEISDSPDFLIYSCYGAEHMNYSCYRIFYNGENVRVNWNACDYAFGFDYLDDERYFRLPNWFWYGDPKSLLQSQSSSSIPPAPEQRKFCNLVVSNGLSKRRIDFFHLLSQYKKCDSGGKYLNNIGGPVDDKQLFLKNYKFSIAFENSSYPGYTTEKIFEALLAHTIPIYWGNPLVDKDFNSASFINAHEYQSERDLIARIIELDLNDDLYNAVLQQPAYTNNQLPVCVNEDKICAQLKKIVEHSVAKPPVATTIRRIYYLADRVLSNADVYANNIFKYKRNFR